MTFKLTYSNPRRFDLPFWEPSPHEGFGYRTTANIGGTNH